MACRYCAAAMRSLEMGIQLQRMQHPPQYHSLFSSFPRAGTNAVTGSFKKFILTLWHKLQHLSMRQSGLRKDKGGRATASWQAGLALPAVTSKGLRCTASLWRCTPACRGAKLLCSQRLRFASQ